MKIAELMTDQLTPIFGGFVIPRNDKQYFEEVESFVNQDEEELKKFAFKIFDVFKEDKITEDGLFTFMRHASMRKIGEDAAPTKILSLNELENDIFIDIFSNSYNKILKALAKKKADSEKNKGIINLAKSRAARNSSQREQYASMKQASIIMSDTQKNNLANQLAFAAISG